MPLKSPSSQQGGLFATFCEKIGDPLKKESFTTRGSIIFPPKVVKRPPGSQWGTSKALEFQVRYHQCFWSTQNLRAGKFLQHFRCFVLSFCHKGPWPSLFNVEARIVSKRPWHLRPIPGAYGCGHPLAAPIVIPMTSLRRKTRK